MPPTDTGTHEEWFARSRELSRLEELHGLSAFALRDGVPHLTYRTCARGGEALLGVFALLDRTPLGRDEGEAPMGWVRRHDEYPDAAPRAAGLRRALHHGPARDT